MVKFLVIRHTLSAIIIDRHSSQNINRSIFHSPKCIDTILIIFVVFLVSFYFCTKYFYGCTTRQAKDRNATDLLLVLSLRPKVVGLRCYVVGCQWFHQVVVRSLFCDVSIVYLFSIFITTDRELIVIISRIDYWFRLSSNRSFNPFFLVFFFLLSVNDLSSI